MTTPDQIPDLLLKIAHFLVDQPGGVTVQGVPDGQRTLLKLTGKVIGKQGRTARSIRTVLASASRKLRHRISLDIVDGKEEITPFRTECIS